MNTVTNNEFSVCFMRELLSSLTQHYSDNYDYHRFGKYHLKQKLKELVKGILHKSGFYRMNPDVLTRYMNGGETENFEYLYTVLNDAESKELLIKIILYRLLGHSKVKLPLNDAGMLRRMDESRVYSFPHDVLPLKFLNWKLIKYDLRRLNYPIQVYSNPIGIVTQYIFKQYVYQTSEVTVKPEYGDIILDCGGCFGEAALFFAHETGPEGKVYTFEFIKKNIEICKKNISLNPELAKRILLIEQPVWENSGSRLFYIDDGPASKVAFERFKGAEDETTSVCIDEMVMNSTPGKVDFIKMDIEGAEFPALKGAAATLKTYKPKLAISIYHNPEDFRRIPEFIKAVSPGYQLYLGHYSMHEEETVLFAIHEERKRNSDVCAPMTNRSPTRVHPEDAVTVVFRYDDYSSKSRTDLEVELLDIFRKQHIPLTVSVIPYICAIDCADPAPQAVVPLTESKANELRQASSDGLIDVALHGYSHHNRKTRNYSEFEGLDYLDQYAKIEAGKRLLEQLIGVPITKFVPPWNTYDLNTLAALDALGFKCISAAPTTGPVSHVSSLKYVPQTCDLVHLKKTMKSAASLPGSQKIINTVIHEFDFIDADRKRGRFTLSQFTELLSWVASQRGINIRNLEQVLEEVEDLGPERFAHCSPHKKSLARFFRPWQQGTTE